MEGYVNARPDPEPVLHPELAEAQESGVVEAAVGGQGLTQGLGRLTFWFL